MKNTYREILPGINLRVIETDRFKTACFSASFLTPLCRDSAAKCALIPYVLRRGTRGLPDMMRISAALDMLYGAQVEPNVRKFGNIQSTGLICDLVTPEYLSDATGLLEDTIAIALEILLDPIVINDAFLSEYVESEREKLIDIRKSEFNDKLTFAYTSAVGAFYENDGFGIHELGDVADIAKIEPEELYEEYKKLLRDAPLELFFCGNATFEQVKSAVMPILSRINREYDKFVPLGKPKLPEKRELCVQYDVAQANLLVGLYTPVRAGSVEQPAMHVLAAILGVGSASKLFRHVREEKSLCYYTGARYDKYLQTVFMYAGVDPSRVEEARGEMLRQLMECCNGNIDDNELAIAKRRLIDRFKTTGDLAVELEDYWAGESVMGLSRELDFRIERIRSVTVEDAVEAAKTLVNCMTYVLTGKEEHHARRGLPGNC